jgi:hypothetical protein
MSEREQIEEYQKSAKYLNPRVKYYISLCRQCDPNLKKLCRSAPPDMGVYNYLYEDKETMPWCCHAENNINGALSDGSVKPETIHKVVSTAEKFAKELGMIGVTTVTLDLAFAELANNFEYQKFEGKPPKRAEPLDHTHLDACINCDPEFAAQCRTQADQKDTKGLVDIARKYTTGIWCGHAVEALASLMLNKKFDEAKVEKLASLAKKISEDDNFPGVWVRHLFIALGRAAA